MIEKQKYRRNSFAADYGAKDDDFILADLDVMRDEEETPPVPLNHFMDDEDVIDRLLVNTGFDDIQDREDAMTTDQDLLDSENSKLAFEQEEESDLMVQEEDAETDNEKQVKPGLVFVSLDNPGKIELNVTGTEEEHIQQLIQDYEHNAKKAAVMTYASLGIGLVALLSAVIMGAVVFGMHSKIAKLSDLVSILEEDMASIAGKNSDLDINNNAASIEQLNQKLNSQPESLEEQIPSSIDISGNKRALDAKKQADANKSLNNPQSKPPVLENKKSSEATVKKLSTEKKAGKTQAIAGWSVNLNAYEDQNYAKNKAAKFSQKGIPVRVIPVDMNNAKWYRLKVGGFKSKEEATAYAVKIKKSLNLNSVSVVDK